MTDSSYTYTATCCCGKWLGSRDVVLQRHGCTGRAPSGPVLGLRCWNKPNDSPSLFERSQVGVNIEDMSVLCRVGGEFPGPAGRGSGPEPPGGPYRASRLRT